MQKGFFWPISRIWIMAGALVVEYHAQFCISLLWYCLHLSCFPHEQNSRDFPSGQNCQGVENELVRFSEICTRFIFSIVHLKQQTNMYIFETRINKIFNSDWITIFFFFVKKRIAFCTHVPLFSFSREWCDIMTPLRYPSYNNPTGAVSVQLHDHTWSGAHASKLYEVRKGERRRWMQAGYRKQMKARTRAFPN